MAATTPEITALPDACFNSSSPAFATLADSSVGCGGAGVAELEEATAAEATIA